MTICASFRGAFSSVPSFIFQRNFLLSSPDFIAIFPCYTRIAAYCTVSHRSIDVHFTLTLFPHTYFPPAPISILIFSRFPVSRPFAGAADPARADGQGAPQQRRRLSHRHGGAAEEEVPQGHHAHHPPATGSFHPSTLFRPRLSLRRLLLS